MRHSLCAVAAGTLVLAAAAPAHATCGATFCMINTNWNIQGLAPEPGLRMDLRFEYIDQDQPRAGSGKVPFGQIRRHHDEVRTINRNYVATFDYTINADWAVVASVPFVDRSHLHIHNHGGGQVPEQWSFQEFGDVQLLARRQWMSEDTANHALSFYGITFGAKLPTGSFTVRNDAGDLAERSLQPGSGTTDVLLGGFFSRVLPERNLSWFVQGLAQLPTAYRDNYKPGRRFTFDAGVRYELGNSAGLMLQVNALHKGRDGGSEGEPNDTGGNFLYVSPGVSYAILPKTQVYAFVQKPIYQYVNGVQITADWSVLVGLSSRF